MSAGVKLYLLGVALLAAYIAWDAHSNPCGPFPDWRSSPYVLPYPAGTSYLVNQANCTSGGHKGPYRFGYDFSMAVGTPVTAAREGVVTEVWSSFQNGDVEPGHENLIKVRHVDGTFATYAHLSPEGVLVKVGNRVRAGDPLGLSGNTGKTGGLPHLHFQVTPCPWAVKCGTLPVTFRNTDPNPSGLETKRRYRALDASQ